MSYPISLEQIRKQSLKQTQRLMMTPQMQQAIQLLQLPVMGLVKMVEQELEQNPVLEYIQEEGEAKKQEQNEEKELEFTDKQFEVLKQLDEEFSDLFAESGQFTPRRTSEEEKRKAFLDSTVLAVPTLRDHLMAQAREAFSSEEELQLTEILLGYIDESGYLNTPLEEIATSFHVKVDALSYVLKVIKIFDPPGIGAKNLQEILLLQLERQGKKESLAYRIIAQYYDHLLHNRLPMLRKELKASMEEITHAVQEEIARLDLHPTTSFSTVSAQAIIPDASIQQDGDELRVEVNEEPLQPLRLNRKYLRMLSDETLPKETKDFIRTKLLSAKWLVKNLNQRGDTLHRIASYLMEKHKSFFLDSQGQLMPLTMKTVSDALSLHESTVARAVANKYLETPRGIFPFRYFFSSGYVDGDGQDVSSNSIRDLIQEIISQEDKKHPLSDELISQMIREKGIACARRTVAKYRTQLKIGNTQQRRSF